MKRGKSYIKKIRIDLHNHTNFSDGDLYLVDLCHLKKDILDVICITDHFPSYPLSYELGKCCAQEYNIQHDNSMPYCIVGIEYALPSGTELLVFGGDAIEAVIRYRPETIKELENILTDYESASIICHPILAERRNDPALLSFVNGIEITNIGMYLKEYEDDFNKIKNKYKLNFFANSDFHSTIFSRKTYSIIHNRDITSERELITCLKDNLTIDFVFGELYTYTN